MIGKVKKIENLFLLNQCIIDNKPKAKIIDKTGKIIKVRCRLGTSSKVRALPTGASNNQEKRIRLSFQQNQNNNPRVIKKTTITFSVAVRQRLICQGEIASKKLAIRDNSHLAGVVEISTPPPR